MKYIKQYEELNSGLPKINEYVICEVGDVFDTYNISNLNLFLNNNIGQIVNINRYDIYQIKYQNIPDDISNMFTTINNNNVRNMRLDNILYCSKNKEELETLLSTNKYNL